MTVFGNLERWILIAGVGGLVVALLVWFLYYRIPESAEGFSERATHRSWVLGLLFPGLVVAYAISSLMTGSFTFYGRGGAYTVEGPAAVAFSLTLLSAAAALHFHFIWGPSKHLWRYSELGKLVSMILTVVFLIRGFYLFFFG